MTRLEALQQARVYVQELYAVKNDRGYPRFSGSGVDVLREEIKVAEFLLEGDDDITIADRVQATERDVKNIAQRLDLHISATPDQDHARGV